LPDCYFQLRHRPAAFGFLYLLAPLNSSVIRTQVGRASFHCKLAHRRDCKLAIIAMQTTTRYAAIKQQEFKRHQRNQAACTLCRTEPVLHGVARKPAMTKAVEASLLASSKE
jgi:hypothetical protein